MITDFPRGIHFYTGFHNNTLIENNVISTISSTTAGGYGIYALASSSNNNTIYNNIDNVNAFLKKIISSVLDNLESEVGLQEIIRNSYEFIEKNNNLLKYGDLHLYEHQKTIFTAVKNVNPKLILYIAPTGTGKTLTPLGLSESYKVIFVCAARHVGIALARSAISTPRPM